MSECTICGRTVEWAEVLSDFQHLVDQVDLYGEDSLTEQEQVVYHGLCCSRDCYERLQ